MIGALDTDVVLSLATVSVSALAVVGILQALSETRSKTDRIDVDALVESAPYHVLVEEV
ncbi:MAG: hypothetical protein ACU0BN_07240 [Sulfitobacter sp.]